MMRLFIELYTDEDVDVLIADHPLSAVAERYGYTGSPSSHPALP
jgi:hypothetical protein